MNLSRNCFERTVYRGGKSRKNAYLLVLFVEEFAQTNLGFFSLRASTKENGAFLPILGPLGGRPQSEMGGMVVLSGVGEIFVYGRTSPIPYAHGGTRLRRGRTPDLW